MWVFTQIADGWDRLREEDGRFLDEQFTSWTKHALDHSDDPEWYSPLRNVAIYTGVGLGYATWTLSTSVATGFIDTLRLGDGVQEGGWGYGKDALRLLVFAGPALRLGRLGLSRLASIDAFPATGTCAWVAAAKALRMTGVKHFARVEDLAKSAGVFAPNFPAVTSIAGVVLQYIRQLGGVARSIPGTAPAGAVEKALATAVAKNPNAVIMFGVRWNQAGKNLGHAMIALRHLGRTVILDRTGKIVTALKDLPYTGIATATLDEMVLIENATAATVISALSKAALVTNSALAGVGAKGSNKPSAEQALAPEVNPGPLLREVGLEVRSVPLRKERNLRSRSTPAAPMSSKTTITTNCYPTSSSVDLREGGRVIVPRRWCESVTVDYKVYVVKPGDYLAKIAKGVYGSANRWPYIYRANTAKLGSNPHDPTKLRAGMELDIPISASRRIFEEATP